MSFNATGNKNYDENEPLSRDLLAQRKVETLPFSWY